jgi:hypothetical protein
MASRSPDCTKSAIVPDNSTGITRTPSSHSSASAACETDPTADAAQMSANVAVKDPSSRAGNEETSEDEGVRSRCPKRQKLSNDRYRTRLKGRSLAELADALAKLPAMKTCTRCNRSLLRAVDFAKKSDMPDGRKRECRECVRAQLAQKLRELRQYQLQVKSRGCQICGWTGHPEALDFAHLSPSSKKRDRRGRTVGPSRFRSKTEFKKEERVMRVLCAVCHQLETGTIPTPSEHPAKRKLREYVEAEKTKRKCCADCRLRVTHDAPFRCFDFDHLPQFPKVETISNMQLKPQSFTLDHIRTEISKCDLVCKRCHRIRTATRRLQQQYVK